MTRSATTSLTAFAAALALAAPLPAVAGGGLGGFRLPTPSPTPSQEVVGPVAPDVPESRVQPRSQPSPSPTPAAQPSTRATSPAPRPSASTPIARPSAGQGATPPAAISDRPAPTAAPQTQAGSSPLTVDPSPQNPAQGQDPGAQSPAAPGADPFDFGNAQAGAQGATDAGPDAAPSDDGGIAWWWYALALLGILGAVMAVAVLRLRGLPSTGPVAVPQIRKPKPRPLPGADTPAEAPSTPPARPAAASGTGPVISAASGPLGLAMSSRRISLSMMAATLDYELTLVNSGSETVRGIEIQGDLVSAHASIPTQQQVAAADSPLEKRHQIAELAPGAQEVVKGQIRLPYSAIRAVAQGKAPLLIPLSRWRIVAQEPQLAPLVQTFLVGQKSDRRQQGIQPFPLDQGPGVFAPLAQRSFA